MPEETTVTLTPEEQKKFDAILAERGWDDKAATVLKKTRDEAKAHREAKEATEAELKKFKDADAERTKSEKAAALEAEEAKKAAELAKKSEIEQTVEKRLKEISESLERRLTEAEKKAVKKQEDLLGELKARDRKILEQEVKVAAVNAGLLDDTLVKLYDLSDVTTKDGEPDTEKISEIIAAHKEAHPKLYKDENEDTPAIRKIGDAFVRPDEKKGPSKGPDWSALSPQEFEAAEAKLRVSKR